jgi:uncharacterized protein (TIGR02145 family)
MKTKIFLVTLTGIILIVVMNCKKEEIQGNAVSYSDSSRIIFNPDLTYGTLTDIDGNSYKTIQIGTQVWMAENLRTTHYSDGTTIPLVTGDDSWSALTYNDKAFCWFNNDSASNAITYGALYTWTAAMNGAVSSSSSPSGIQGVCPSGWHLPSDNEWTILTDYLGGLDVAGTKLKETDTLHWRSPNTVATNESGFTALPGGHRSYDAIWWDIRDLGFWWSSTEEDYYSRWYRVIVSTESTAEMYRRTSLYQDGFSVRCVKGDQYKTVMTSAATNISPDEATLNGYVLANNLSTTVTFEYGTSTSYGQTVSAIQSPIDGSTSTNVSAKITGLTLGTYHFRVKAVNSSGTYYGDDISFSTIVGKFPTFTPIYATNISSTGATLNSTVTANTFPTTVTFEYGTTENYGDSAIASQSPVTGDTSSIVSADIKGLTPGTSYYCRLKVENPLGYLYCYRILITTFTCDQGPTVTTLTATNISANGRTLNSTVNANGLSTIVTFEIRCCRGALRTVTAVQSPVTGNTNTDVTADITGLTSGVVYRVKVKAVNSCGTAYSGEIIFTQ